MQVIDVRRRGQRAKTVAPQHLLFARFESQGHRCQSTKCLEFLVAVSALLRVGPIFRVASWSANRVAINLQIANAFLELQLPIRIRARRLREQQQSHEYHHQELP